MIYFFFLNRPFFVGNTTNERKGSMRKVKVIGYVVGILWLVVAVQVIVNHSFKDENKMLDAFTNTKSQVIKSQLKVVGQYGVRYLTEEDKETMIKFVAGKIGLEADTPIEKAQGTKTLTYTLQKKGTYADSNIEFISVDTENKSKAMETKQYLMVTLTIYEQLNNILNYKNMVEDALDELQLDSYDTAIFFEGCYDGQLSLEKRNEIVEEVMQQLQGRIVIDHRADELFTVYCYTPLVEEYIVSNGEKVNINLAFHYNEEANQTRVYMASPILNEEY